MQKTQNSRTTYSKESKGLCESTKIRCHEMKRLPMQRQMFYKNRKLKLVDCLSV